MKIPSTINKLCMPAKVYLVLSIISIILYMISHIFSIIKMKENINNSFNLKKNKSSDNLLKIKKNKSSDNFMKYEWAWLI